MIELRSDTFTLPTKEMLEEVNPNYLGDDIYGEDSYVLELERKAAEIFDKEASLLFPSGTMANLTAIMAHSPRGSKVIVGNESDIYIYEAGGASVCGGIIYEPINTQEDGRLLIQDIERAIPLNKEDPQFSLPSLICIENPHNRMGGRILPLTYLKEMSEYARSKELPIHMDGARIFNASQALNVEPRVIAEHVDSLQFCLSKGLSAPIGSMLVGNKDFILNARRIRKMLGGGMRQAGIIAKPGIVALNSMVSRLKKDHENAKKLGVGLSKIPGIECNVEKIETNIVFFRVIDERYSLIEFIKLAKYNNLNIDELGYGRIRAVTHSGIDSEDIEQALTIIKRIMN
ncbi:GntG family PLP-dependent aldolase [Sporosarcina psychrophila]|uniref:Threonine aldolase n=1 Tax=Sporosarcina psychrophila TaxID=1476 RepID=A0ABV2KAF3_SPOPS